MNSCFMEDMWIFRVIDVNGYELWKYEYFELKYFRCLIIDCVDCIYIIGYFSNNIYVFSNEGYVLKIFE